MHVRLLVNPTLEEAARALERSVRRRALILILGECSARYEGRSASELGPGERLVILKPDGSVLVHRPTGYSPVNWQPDSVAIDVSLSDGALLVRSVRGRPREVLEVAFTRVDLVVAAEDVRDDAEFVEYMTESELRDLLARHPEVIEPGLRVLAVEKPLGAAGYADIFAVDSKGRPVVIEVKRMQAGRDAVEQLRRYVEAVKSGNPKAEVRGVLVAPSLSRDAQQLLARYGLEFRRVDVPQLFRRFRSEIVRSRGAGGGAASLLSFLGVSRSSGQRSGGSSEG